jgi:hypothetical protein
MCRTASNKKSIANHIVYKQQKQTCGLTNYDRWKHVTNMLHGGTLHWYLRFEYKTTNKWTRRGTRILLAEMVDWSSLGSFLNSAQV